MIDRLARFFSRPPEAPSTDGSAHEIAFWENWVEAAGGPWPADFQARLDPQRELPEWITARLPQGPGATVEILDVGAGPLTILGPCWSGRRVNLTAVDPLAGQYDRLLASAGILPPIRTQFGEAERVANQFGENAFDLVHCQNALDHCEAPMTALRQMVRTCRPGGQVALFHYVDEGEREEYVGFHRWNLRLEDERLVLWNRSFRHDVLAELGPGVSMFNVQARPDWVETWISKRPATEVSAYS